ncbi:hypothetical protein SDC9_108137 [bioreactor metagenome]|uniref:Uncharacterized protein n=1 Tax=bioreactor metagenome TaxID=1076179 RepID=A0A645B735_9ZZZZ
MEAISSAITRLSNMARDTFLCTIRSASPSTMADFPTPGSPMRTGLFFLRRLSIWAILSISFSRPTIGSRRFSIAARVMSVPKLSSTGVSEAGFFACDCPPCCPPGLKDDFPPCSSSSSSVKFGPMNGVSALLSARASSMLFTYKNALE